MAGEIFKVIDFLTPSVSVSLRLSLFHILVHATLDRVSSRGLVDDSAVLLITCHTNILFFFFLFFFFLLYIRTEVSP